MMLEERYEEFRKEIRDPYPSIGEKAVGRYGKDYIVLGNICCVIIFGIYLKLAILGIGWLAILQYWR